MSLVSGMAEGIGHGVCRNKGMHGNRKSIGSILSHTAGRECAI